MAKTNQKKAKAPSVHSRAARRATSPSINTDKSLKDVQLPEQSLNQRPSVLGIHQNAGVTKKIKRGRKSVMSSRARKRQERGLEKAEGVIDRTAVKVQKSKRSATNIAERKKGWEEVNVTAIKTMAGTNKFAGLVLEGAGEDDDEEWDDEMEEEVVEEKKKKEVPAASAPATIQQDDDSDEEIL